MLYSRHSILINRNIEDVYHFVAVNFFENYQKWSPEVCELEKLTAGEMRIGVAGRQVRYDQGYRSEAYFRVSELTPMHRLRFISTSKPYFDISYMFEPVVAATRLNFNFQMSLPLLMRPIHSRIHDAVTRGGHRVVTNLQSLLEIDADV